eukprot:4618934-Amphidinium_carterae.1
MDYPIVCSFIARDLCGDNSSEGFQSSSNCWIFQTAPSCGGFQTGTVVCATAEVTYSQEQILGRDSAMLKGSILNISNWTSQ